jgi:hypothetical protein
VFIRNIEGRSHRWLNRGSARPISLGFHAHALLSVF